MITGQNIYTYLMVVLFALAVIAPILQQLVDYSSIQIQLVEELPDKDTDTNDKEEKEKENKFFSAYAIALATAGVMASSHLAELVHSADYSSMLDPPPEFV